MLGIPALLLDRLDERGVELADLGIDSATGSAERVVKLCERGAVFTEQGLELSGQGQKGDRQREREEDSLPPGRRSWLSYQS